MPPRSFSPPAAQHTTPRRKSPSEPPETPMSGLRRHIGAAMIRAESVMRSIWHFKPPTIVFRSCYIRTPLQHKNAVAVLYFAVYAMFTRCAADAETGRGLTKAARTPAGSAIAPAQQPPAADGLRVQRSSWSAVDPPRSDRETLSAPFCEIFAFCAFLRPAG